MWRSVRQLAPPGVVLGVVLVAVAGCGFTSAPQQADGRAASISLSLKTVPTIRSVTVSPARATFGDCSRGSAAANTLSTRTKLGYPNGICWFGSLTATSYPILITNTGIASYVYVEGSQASPADGGDSWSLCNVGSQPAVTCKGKDGAMPGVDQYLLRNFGPDGLPNRAGLTGNPVCDHEFSTQGGCWASQGQFQNEGVELIGPSASTDNSTSWTVTITWMPVPK